VATIDVDSGAVAIFGLPRNFKGVPLPEKFHDVFVDDELAALEATWTDENLDGIPDQWVDLDGDLIPDEPEFESCDCYMEMLNTVHGRTWEWTSSYPNSPDPGMSALRDIIEEFLDLDIDYFVLVDMAAFVRGIDAIGGVDVMVESPMHVTVSAPWEGSPKATVRVEAGMNHLDGMEALAYSRWRWGSSDYARMERQRCLVRAAVAQANPANLLLRFSEIASVIEDYVLTDIPRNFLPDLVRVAGKIDFGDIATVGLVPPTYVLDRAPGGYPIPDVERIRNKVRQVLSDGASAQSRTGESECGI
jgi:polyisoprenyl-teichoic acid--peptidoglycan teichoic acid transferase